MDFISNNYQIILAVAAVAIFSWACGKSPTWADKARLTLVPISIALTALISDFTFGLYEHVTAEDPNTIYQLGVIPFLFIIYFIASLVSISFAAWKKKGYRNLMYFGEDGLIVGLVWGFIAGLIGGLAVGLVFGLEFGLAVGLVFGLATGLVFGLVWGFIAGLKSEFKNKTTNPV